MAGIKIDYDECIGCGECINVCLYDALNINDEDIAEVNLEKCTLCGACASECPADAIEVEAERSSQKDKDDYHGIWVYAEQWSGSHHDVVFELLTEARRLADDLGEYLGVIAVGSNIKEAAQEFITYGADKVFILEHDDLAIPNDEVYAYLITKAVQKYKPAVMLYGATAFGRSLAPRIAGKLNTGLTADCTKLEIDKEKKLLLQTRPAFGGNVMATIVCPEHRPQMATVRPKVFKKQIELDDPQGKIINEDVDLDTFESKSVIEKIIAFTKNEFRLEDAEVVVAGGAGFANNEEFALVKELADALDGSVGGSRCAVDACYCSHSSQVGQTGKVIAPRIYIAAGISGAIQHMVGMENSSLIIAINKDPDAAIFQIADIGMVGDAKKIIPALIQAVNKAKEKKADKVTV